MWQARARASRHDPRAPHAAHLHLPAYAPGGGYSPKLAVRPAITCIKAAVVVPTGIVTSYGPRVVDAEASEAHELLERLLRAAARVIRLCTAPIIKIVAEATIGIRRTAARVTQTQAARVTQTP
jgi:hypothetical protein